MIALVKLFIIGLVVFYACQELFRRRRQWKDDPHNKAAKLYFVSALVMVLSGAILIAAQLQGLLAA